MSIMADLDFLSIKEVSELVGLPTHTIRYYETQFPLSLDVERTSGGHRVYRQRHLEPLNRIIKLVKQEKHSIKSARLQMGELDVVFDRQCESKPAKAEKESIENLEISSLLIHLIDRLDRICKSNERRDELLEKLVRESSSSQKNSLLREIERYRTENRENMRIYQAVLDRRLNSN